MIAVFNPPKDENPLAGGFPSAATNQHCADDSANRAREKLLSTIRSKLCLSGGQRLRVAEDGVYFVTTPFGQITRFDSLTAPRPMLIEVPDECRIKLSRCHA